MIGYFFLRPPVGATLNSQLTANEARSASRRANTEVDILLDRFDRLSLVTQAMWELIESSTDLKEGDLLSKIEEVDLRDGKLDGKVAAPVADCPSCQRKSTRNHKICMYCGEALPKAPFA